MGWALDEEPRNRRPPAFNTNVGASNKHKSFGVHRYYTPKRLLVLFLITVNFSVALAVLLSYIASMVYATV